MLNVRLGWWLGNPGKEGQRAYADEGPRNAIALLLEETFGLTTDEKVYILLFDGGHFENLGLYEMIRRRCRIVLVSDAGYDPDFTFEDLGNAVRKIEIDFGIPVINWKRLEPDRKNHLKQAQRNTGLPIRAKSITLWARLSTRLSTPIARTAH